MLIISILVGGSFRTWLLRYRSRLFSILSKVKKKQNIAALAVGFLQTKPKKQKNKKKTNQGVKIVFSLPRGGLSKLM